MLSKSLDTVAEHQGYRERNARLANDPNPRGGPPPNGFVFEGMPHTQVVILVVVMLWLQKSNLDMKAKIIQVI